MDEGSEYNFTEILVVNLREPVSQHSILRKTYRGDSFQMAVDQVGSDFIVFSVWKTDQRTMD